MLESLLKPELHHCQCSNHLVCASHWRRWLVVGVDDGENAVILSIYIQMQALHKQHNLALQSEIALSVVCMDMRSFEQPNAGSRGVYEQSAFKTIPFDLELLRPGDSNGALRCPFGPSGALVTLSSHPGFSGVWQPVSVLSSTCKRWMWYIFSALSSLIFSK